MSTYLLIMTLFCSPLAFGFFAERFFPDHEATASVKALGLASPFAVAFEVPLVVEDSMDESRSAQIPQGTKAALMGFSLEGWSMFAAYLTFTTLMNGLLVVTMIWLFGSRWRVSQ